ncbi:MAG: metallophosphoesterase [Candidatus Diapherotrites archaeon]
MKILVIGDLHGRKPKIHFNDFDCIIQVGDVCDDSKFRPYYKLWFYLLKELGEDAPSAKELMLSDIGEEGIKRLERNSLAVGRKILEYLNSIGKPVFFVPGNWDQSRGETKIKNPEASNYAYFKSGFDGFLGANTNEFLIRGLKNVYDCQFKNKEFNKINFIGYGLSSNQERIIKKSKKKLTKLEISKLDKVYFKIMKVLSSSYNLRNKKYPAIFISHNVPYNTKLDIVKNKNSVADKRHLGSYVARKFCEKYKPLICIGGHVHEGVGKDKIGKTLIINPGYGVNAQVLIDIDEDKGKIRDVKFYGKRKK